MEEEIQGLRGIAIILIVFFNLWPSIFPNCYTGIDVFFVISGYLMALSFAKYSTINFNNIIEFYFKRCKRVVSLYFLLLPLIFILNQLFSTPGWISLNTPSYFFSFFFLRNVQSISDSSTYLQTFQATYQPKDLFLHCWSISIGAQFLLVAPILFIFLHFLNRKALKIAVLYILCIATGGYSSYGDSIFTWNFFLTRAWQFGLGILVFTCKDRLHNEGRRSTMRTSIHQMAAVLGFLQFLLVLTGMNIPPDCIQPLTSVSTAILLTIKTDISAKILSSDLLVFLGNISFSLYLVNWPLIVLLKERIVIQNLLVLILLISIGCYYYESWYQKLPYHYSTALILWLLLLNISIVSFFTYLPFILKKIDAFRYRNISPKIEDCVRENIRFMHKSSLSEGIRLWDNHLFQLPYGIGEEKNGTKERKILVVGNDYALNQAKMIEEVFRGNYSSFQVVTGPVFYNPWKSTSIYSKQHWAAMEHIEKVKPDILFVIVRLNREQAAPLERIGEKRLPNLYTKMAEILERVCGRIFILGYTPDVPKYHHSSFVNALMLNSSLDHFNLDPKLVHKHLSPAQMRLNRMICSKCKIFSYISALFVGDSYLTYDPKTNLSFYDNDGKFTQTGLERVRPVYQRLISTI